MLIALLVFAILSFLYGIPSGRRVRRDGVRAFRLARNFTGISPVPVLTLRLWNSTSQRAVLIEVYESGRIVAFRHGERFERTLAAAAAATIVGHGRVALGVFSTGDCGTVPRADGFNAELYLFIDGHRVGSLCRDASTWPEGAEARLLFSAIENHFPGLLPSGR
jgi:hypothetical protein